MKILKILGIIVLVIVILGVLAIVFGPSEVHMERKVSINAPVEAVFAEINGFKTFDQFSAWSEVDTTAQIIIEGPTAGVGASYSWKSDNPDFGTGTIEIIESDQNMMVKSKMNFEGLPGEPTAAWFLEEKDGSTAVTYTYDQADISGIWKLFAYGTEGMLGPMYERTLDKLKTRVENRPQFDARITLEEVGAISYAGIEVTSSNESEEISRVMGDAYGDIMAALAQNGIPVDTGYPLAVATDYSEASISMICGIPVPDGTSIDSELVSVRQSPEGATLRALHFGDYNLLEETHDQIDQYAKYYGYEITGMPWEVYVTDPAVEVDTSKWLTEVYYPVK